MENKNEDPETENFQVTVKEECYYKMLSDMSGIAIEGEYQLISLIRDLSMRKKEYEFSIKLSVREKEAVFLQFRTTVE